MNVNLSSLGFLSRRSIYDCPETRPPITVLDTGHDLSTQEVRDILTTTAIGGRLNLTGALEEVNYRNPTPPETDSTCYAMYQNADGTSTVLEVPCSYAIRTGRSVVPW
jgi:hypothetical protein